MANFGGFLLSGFIPLLGGSMLPKYPVNFFEIWWEPKRVPFRKNGWKKIRQNPLFLKIDARETPLPPTTLAKTTRT
jgi:hypothetical protein